MLTAYIQELLTDGWLFFSDLKLCLKKTLFYNHGSIVPLWIFLIPPGTLQNVWSPGVFCGNKSVLNCCAVQDVSSSPPTFLSCCFGFLVFFERGLNNRGWKLQRQPDFTWGLVMPTCKWWRRGRTSWETVQSVLLGLHRRWTGNKNSIFLFLVNIKTKKEKSKVKEFCCAACCHGYCITQSIQEAHRISLILQLFHSVWFFIIF